MWGLACLCLILLDTVDWATGEIVFKAWFPFFSQKLTILYLWYRNIFFWRWVSRYKFIYLFIFSWLVFFLCIPFANFFYWIYIFSILIYHISDNGFNSIVNDFFFSFVKKFSLLRLHMSKIITDYICQIFELSYIFNIF